MKEWCKLNFLSLPSGLKWRSNSEIENNGVSNILRCRPVLIGFSWHNEQKEWLINVFCNLYDVAKDKDKVNTTNKDDSKFDFIQ